MELAQCNYMREQPPWNYEGDSADILRVILADILRNLATSLG
jgi:N-formylglutamate amidohydrolase